MCHSFTSTILGPYLIRGELKKNPYLEVSLGILDMYQTINYKQKPRQRTASLPNTDRKHLWSCGFLVPTLSSISLLLPQRMSHW